MKGLLLAMLVGGAAFCAPARAVEKPPFGISANPKEGATGTEFLRGIQDAKAAGARLMYISHKWGDLEQKPGEYNLKDMENGLRYLSALGFKIAVTIQTLDTNNRTLPPDLMEKPFDAPEVQARFDAMLKAVAPKLTPAVRWVMLGNEVDIYLAAHPAETEPFAGFVEHGRETLRALQPGMLVGVTVTHDGVRDRGSLCRRLNRGMDVATLTYYPLKPDFGVRPVSDVAGDFDRMVRFAGQKPLLVQEVGYPADPLLGSSEEKQAAFVEAVFDAMARHADRLAGVNFFLLHDFGDTLVEGFLKYYRLPNPRFRAYLATLGLKKADGTPRAAWARFQARGKAWAE